MQTALAYRTNRDLFSNYYLDEHLPETDAWNAVDEEDLQAAYEDVRALYEREKDTAPKRNESQLGSIVSNKSPCEPDDYQPLSRATPRF